jgi:hypothetical protein
MLNSRDTFLALSGRVENVRSRHAAEARDSIVELDPLLARHSGPENLTFDLRGELEVDLDRVLGESIELGETGVS